MKQNEADKRTIRLGMFGFGVVGTAVYRLLQQQAAHLAQKAGAALEVRRVVVRDLHKPRGIDLPPGLLATDPATILDDPEIDIVVEVMGGIQPTLDYVLAALRRGKSVVTANKELVADYSQEALAAARSHGADFFFEASVGGGIPVLRPLLDTLSAGEIRQIAGIVNGTTNYILDQMTRLGKDFAQALAEAQALGYAEADPTADVEGHDPARKIAILSSIAFRTHVRSGAVPTQGITQVTPEDIAYGAERGLVLKLIAFAQRQGDELEARVQPCFIPHSHPLAGVADAFNAIFVHGDEVGQTMFYGRGAGGLPTGSAVVGDILAAARNRRLGVAFAQPWVERRLNVRPAGGGAGRYYVRLQPAEPALARAEVVAAAAGAAPPTPVLATQTEVAAGLADRLAEQGVPVAHYAVLPNSQVAVETAPVSERVLHQALSALGEAVSPGISVRILD